MLYKYVHIICIHRHTCKIKKGRIQCGSGCTQVKLDFEKLEKREKEASVKEREKKQKNQSDQSEPRKEAFQGGMGVKVEKGLKLSQEHMQILLTEAQMKESSTNPLCKDSSRSKDYYAAKSCGHETCRRKLPIPRKKARPLFVSLCVCNGLFSRSMRNRLSR